MAPPSPRESKAPSATSAAKSDEEMVLPGFPDADSFVKFALGSVVAVTKASGGLPQFGDEYDFYRSFPGFQAFCETQGDRLLQCMSRVMQYHGCRSNIKDRKKVTELEDKFDLLVDTNDVILERVGILLDEASGVNKNQQPVLPAGLQVPKTIVSSWNRKAGEYSKKSKSETFRLLHAKNIIRPQLKFREKIDNSNTPFLPKIFIKPNAQKPLPQALSKERRDRPQDRPEDLDVPPALADFIHQQRTQQVEQDMFAHPYQYELDHFTPPDSVLQKPQPQLYRPVGETPCHFVSSLDELVELNEKLLNCQEFAVDLEHHSYRSFLGLTCLMQISTRTEDFIVDTLELRSDMYILNESLTDPAIVKVFHGADSDIEWLQKDFGLYVVNMFDTHQAARLLNLGRHSLDHLLKLYCNVESNKQYQLDTKCLIATAVITLFNEPSAEETGQGLLTVAQKKAQNIMESFENPFRMFLPSVEHHAHISQAAKFDPSSKIYEISNRWKLASQVQVQKESKESARKKAAEQTAARDQANEEYKATAKQAVSVRQQAALENTARKRERTASDPRTAEQKQEKKRLKISKKPKDPDPPEKEFTPYDYSKSDFKAFAGNGKSRPSQFDPSKQTPPGKKCFAAKKLKQSMGSKSMSFPAEKSDRGFRHNWPKR
uniref:Exosome component 10 n=1 Tax=Rousettus aegyptiacus TaxID=9407 RepID=A0A7J8K801_ROUAE|nr:exosome component 10 [Rousettus aegyptiacus]